MVTVIMAVFGWLLLIWIIGIFPPIGVIIGISALIWGILTDPR